jgi:hypothetical protein
VKTVNSWRAPRFWSTPIFCDFLAWQAGTTRPGQYRKQSSHISWPAGCSCHSASTRGGDNIFRRRTPARSGEKSVTVQRRPDRMWSLDKPPASLALLPSRARSRTCSYPALLEFQRRYEAIRVWSYTTFIVNEAVVNRKLAVKT